MSLVHLCLAPLLLVACDSMAQPEVASAPLTHGRDPFEQSIIDVTSVFSDAGIAIRDSEWEILSYGLQRTRMPVERLRAALDQLALVAPFPALFRGLELPAELVLAEAFAPAAPGARTRAAWRTTDEHVVLYALPSAMRATVAALVAQANGVIIVVDVRLVRRSGDSQLIGAAVSLGWSDCGWCQEGTTTIIDQAGNILAQWWPEWLAAYGYCC